MTVTDDAESALPRLAADLTWVRVNGGRTYSSLSDWDEDRDPTVGEHVLVSDGRPFVEAVIVALDSDGTIHLRIPAFARKAGQAG